MKKSHAENKHQKPVQDPFFLVKNPKQLLHARNPF